MSLPMGKLRVCSWNIQLGRRLEQILVTIAEQSDFAGLDVLALQEASVHSGITDAAAIADRLGKTYDHHQVAAQHLRGWPQANALIWDRSRLSEARCRQFDLPALDDPLGLPRTEGWLLRRVPPQRRGAVVLEATLAGGEHIRVYSAHVDVLGFAHRLRQLGSVLADHASRPEAVMAVIAADLNTFGIGSRPSWQAVHAAAAAAGFREVTSTVSWTHQVRPMRLRQKLDYVFATDRAGLSYRAWTLSTGASDHLPEFVELSWP
jgi:endonuclease/exonuclease/phosphatase family metal-dependent hydrolase